MRDTCFDSHNFLKCITANLNKIKKKNTHFLEYKEALAYSYRTDEHNYKCDVIAKHN